MTQKYLMTVGFVMGSWFSSCAEAQNLSSKGGSMEHFADVEITSHIFKPGELPAPDLSKLHVPSGFRIEKFAENLGNARILAIGPDGSVYVTRREQADVLMLKVGENGLAAGTPVRVASRTGCTESPFQKARFTSPASTKCSEQTACQMAPSDPSR